MANSELIIDEEYISAMRDFLGYSSVNSYYGIEEKIADYIDKMKEIKSAGFVSGGIADAMDAYIACAEKLKGTVRDITAETKDLMSYFLQEIEELEETYLF